MDGFNVLIIALLVIAVTVIFTQGVGIKRLDRELRRVREEQKLGWTDYGPWSCDCGRFMFSKVIHIPDGKGMRHGYSSCIPDRDLIA